MDSFPIRNHTQRQSLFTKVKNIKKYILEKMKRTVQANGSFLFYIENYIEKFFDIPVFFCRIDILLVFKEEQ